MANPYSIYIDPPLRRMRTALDVSGLHGLSQCILELDHTYGPNPTTSRIIDSEDYKGNAEVLLSQISPEMLHSILSNTLPSDVASGQLNLEPWAEISMQPQHKDTLEPGIYANYLAAHDGSPMTLDDFEHFLDGLDAAVMGLRMNDAAQTDISQLVDAHYRINYGNGRGLLHEIRGASLTAAVGTFLQINRVRLQDAQAQGATHITIHGDCGWAINIHDRCRQHRMLVSSPALFRLANCLLSVLFPLKHFRMHHFCIFRAFRFEHAGTGESLGSHLITSYSTYGGFSLEQAGHSVSSSQDLTSNGWMVVSDRYAGLLDKMKTRLDAETAKLTDEAKREKLEAERRRLYQILLQKRANLKLLKEKEEQGIAKMDNALSVMKLQNKSIEDRMAKGKAKVDRRIKEWEDLAKALGIAVGDQAGSSTNGSSE
ncbi:hypothetical protein D6D21_06055 [Aureobasidium pullulans]|uniref:Uncharacterized protein n=1 Tax=Aureobasidium pullulans TaxID=5580 RepID=A0AB74IWL9_AURPU|nr:hypothetical protein D6D21_06055 [Aureobasidium pullulans]